MAGNKKWVILCCLLVLSLCGCYDSIAAKMVTSPNYGKTLDEVNGLRQSQFKKYQIDDHFKVQGSESGIFIDVGVIQPKKEWEITLGTAWYDSMISCSQDWEKKHPNLKEPEKFYWEKCPDNAGKLSGFSFSSIPDDQTMWQQVKGTVILVHGLWMDKTIYALTWGQVLSVYGYRVILVDLRGHGRSTGDYITFGPKESADMISVIDSLDDAGLLEGELFLLGVSLGASVAIETAAKDKRVDGVIAVSPFTSIRDTAPYFSKECFGLLNFLLGEKGINRVIDEAGIIADFDPDANTTLDAVKKLEVPVLFIHGTADRHVSCEHSMRLFRASRVGELKMIEGKGHMNIGTEDIYSFRDIIIDWLDNNGCIK